MVAVAVVRVQGMWAITIDDEYSCGLVKLQLATESDSLKTILELMVLSFHFKQ